MDLNDYIDLMFNKHRGRAKRASPPMFQCPFCREVWGEWGEPGLAAYYVAHPEYPKDLDPPIHYTVCDTCSDVRHLVARIDDEKQRLADLRYTATLFPDNSDLQERIRHHAVQLSILIKDLDTLLSGDPEK